MTAKLSPISTASALILLRWLPEEVPGGSRQVPGQDGECFDPASSLPRHGPRRSIPTISTAYQGKTIYFSSKDALTQFKADPKKYAERLLPEQGLLARGPTTDEDLVLCPVCAEQGGGVHVTQTSPHGRLEGQGVLHVHAGCEEKLKANLAKYEPIIRKQTEKSAANDQWYTCPMHPDVLQKGPGKCPKCSMDLQPLEQGEVRHSPTRAPPPDHLGTNMGGTGMDHSGHQMGAGAMQAMSTDLISLVNKKHCVVALLLAPQPTYFRQPGRTHRKCVGCWSCVRWFAAWQRNGVGLVGIEELERANTMKVARCA